jgi:hypothetical protein
MAITSAVCNTFKTEALRAIHNFTQGGNTFRLALYTDQATLNKSTTQYITANEVANGNGYATKGTALTNVTPALSSDTAVCDFSNISFTSASFTANGCLIFNDTAANDPAVCAIAFGGNKTVTNGTFTIEFPAADASNAILRIA